MNESGRVDFRTPCRFLPSKSNLPGMRTATQRQQILDAVAKSVSIFVGSV